MEAKQELGVTSVSLGLILALAFVSPLLLRGTTARDIGQFADRSNAGRSACRTQPGEQRSV
jgi:hypothetical protein